MNYNDLGYFLEVAVCGNLSHAAERLGISQPSLSVAIKRLEQMTQSQLLLRHKKGVNLTPAGNALLAHAKHLLQAWDDAKNAVRETTQTAAGQLVIGCHASVALHHLPRLVPQLLREHPKLSLKIVNGLSREINEAIIDFKVDLGIVVNPLRHPNLVVRRLRYDWVGFWGIGDDLHGQVEVATLLCDSKLGQTASLIKRLKASGVTITRLLEDDNLENIAQLALHGAGIAVLPESIALRVGKGQLQPILPKLRFKDEICLVYRSENRSLPAVRAFIEVVARGQD